MLCFVNNHLSFHHFLPNCIIWPSMYGFWLPSVVSPNCFHPDVFEDIVLTYFTKMKCYDYRRWWTSQSMIHLKITYILISFVEDAFSYKSKDATLTETIQKQSSISKLVSLEFDDKYMLIISLFCYLAVKSFGFSVCIYPGHSWRRKVWR